MLTANWQNKKLKKPNVIIHFLITIIEFKYASNKVLKKKTFNHLSALIFGDDVLHNTHRKIFGFFSVQRSCNESAKKKNSRQFRPHIQP